MRGKIKYLTEEISQQKIFPLESEKYQGVGIHPNVIGEIS